mmetsp:Transcript_23183/g.46082  ORF Transcript_23183/g.46082 Transcript_23183/m.46082 type:complete len:239 (-) Transcript_23183:2074-2790(-)
MTTAKIATSILLAMRGTSNLFLHWLLDRHHHRKHKLVCRVEHSKIVHPNGTLVVGKRGRSKKKKSTGPDQFIWAEMLILLMIVLLCVPTVLLWLFSDATPATPKDLFCVVVVMVRCTVVSMFTTAIQWTKVSKGTNQYRATNAFGIDSAHVRQIHQTGVGLLHLTAPSIVVMCMSKHLILVLFMSLSTQSIALGVAALRDPAQLSLIARREVLVCGSKTHCWNINKLSTLLADFRYQC